MADSEARKLKSIKDLYFKQLIERRICTSLFAICDLVRNKIFHEFCKLTTRDVRSIEFQRTYSNPIAFGSDWIYSHRTFGTIGRSAELKNGSIVEVGLQFD